MLVEGGRIGWLGVAGKLQHLSMSSELSRFEGDLEFFYFQANGQGNREGIFQFMPLSQLLQ
jgi:hypothetical protein